VVECTGHIDAMGSVLAYVHNNVSSEDTRELCCMVSFSDMSQCSSNLNSGMWCCCAGPVPRIS
jgi:hypothetical protein